MDPSEYQREAGRTECDQHLSRVRLMYPEEHWGTLPDCDRGPTAAVRLNHAIIGLIGEVGELAGALEKWIYYGRDLDKVNVAEELGDCLWYVALACNALGLDLGAVMRANLCKLKSRYPERYTDEAAREENRDRATEARAVEEGVTLRPVGPEVLAALQEAAGDAWPGPLAQAATPKDQAEEKLLLHGNPAAPRPTQTRNFPNVLAQTGHGWAEPPGCESGDHAWRLAPGGTGRVCHHCKILDATARAVELMTTPMKELPPLARRIKDQMTQMLGLCMETCLTAFAYYAQVVEGRPCADPAYTVPPGWAVWLKEQQGQDH